MSRQSVAAILLLLSIFAVGSAAAEDCRLEGVRIWGFARQSPLDGHAAPDEAAEVKRLPVEFSVAYPVLKRDGGYVRVCIDGQAVWISRADVSVTRLPAWIQTKASMLQADRPRLQFWRSMDRLGAYLARGNIEAAPPIYHEVIDGKMEQPIRFPLLRIEAVESGVGNRVIDVANVLIPFPKAAIERYRALRAPVERDAKEPPSFGLVIDVSGSTEGFVPPALQALAAALKKHEHLKRVRVVSAAFGGDGRIEGRTERSALDEAMEKWVQRPAVKAAAVKHDVGKAIKFVRANSASATPLIVLSGGDISVPRRALSKFSNVSFVQITPELQDNLRASARRVSARFYGFAIDPEENFDELFNELYERPPELEMDEAAYEEVASLMRQSRMLPLLPVDIAVAEALAIAPAGARSSDWFATPLWVVLRPDLLEEVLQ